MKFINPNATKTGMICKVDQSPSKDLVFHNICQYFGDAEQGIKTFICFYFILLNNNNRFDCN